MTLITTKEINKVPAEFRFGVETLLNGQHGLIGSDEDKRMTRKSTLSPRSS